MSTSTPTLFIATPCYGGMAHAAFARGLLALNTACAERGVGLQIDLGGGDALVSRARAGALAKFIASSASHLMFIDADIGFTPDQVFRLLDAGRDMVGGLYVRKPDHTDKKPPILEYEPLPGPSAADAEGFQQVGEIGAGFLLISRAAVERLNRGYPDLRARLGDVHGSQTNQAVMLFEPMIEPKTRRYLADHQAFCHRWRALGGEVWADQQSRLTHVGEALLAR